MGTRGPKPGFKQARLAAMAAVPSAEPSPATLVALTVPPVVQAAPVEQAPVLSANDRENPDKLTGDALRQHAHRRGIARSASAAMSDDKLRMELRYITYRQYESEAA